MSVCVHAVRRYVVLMMMVSMLSVVGVQIASVAPAAAASTGDINTIAGTGQRGFSGDGGPATAALLSHPYGVVVDPMGDVYFSDEFNSVVRKIDRFGVITTVAGNGTSGFSGDGGPAASAQLSFPGYLALDKAGDLYIADLGNDRVRKVDPLGIISNFAGNGVTRGLPPDMGNGGPAADAYFSTIGGLAADADGDVFITDPEFNQIRKVDPSGVISLFAGSNSFNFANGVPALKAEFFRPEGLSFDGQGNMLVGTETGLVRKIDMATGLVTTIAGVTGPNGINFGPPGGDGGPATQASLATPALAVGDAAGNVFISDGQGQFNSNNAIRKIDTSGIITTIAGGPTAGYSGDGGPASAAELNAPLGLAVLPDDTVVFADAANNAIRTITGTPNLLRLADVAPLDVAAGASFTYRLAVTNNGSDGDAAAVTVTDPLPAGVSFLSAGASQGSCGQSGGAVTCNLGSLTAGSAASVTITVTAPNQSTSLTDTATVTSSQADPFGADNSATVTTAVAPADLAITMAAPPATGADVGQTVTFTATVTNRGPADASHVTVTDTVPDGLTFSSATASQGSCTHARATVTCSLGTLAAASAGATVSIQVTATGTGPLTDTATVTAEQADPYLANNTASVETVVSGAGCGQTITKSTKLTADIGPCAFDGVVMGADRITLNLDGHRIFGIGNGVDFATLDAKVGIDLPVRTKDTITGGTVSGFDAGIFIDSGLQNTVTHMTVRDNIGEESSGPLFPNYGDGILIEHSAYNKITANQIIHNGTFDGIGVFGVDTDGNVIQANTVENTVTNLSRADGEGIILNNFLAVLSPRRGESLAFNNIIGNLVKDNAASGISNVSNDFAKIENNTVIGNGMLAFPNNGIGDQVGRVADPTASDILSGNVATGNGGNGIQILAPLKGDTVTNNTASSNNVLNHGFFNFEDTNGNCTANQWSNNTSTNGGVSPACILPGGAASSSAAAAAGTQTSGNQEPAPLPQAHRVLPTPSG